MGKIRARVGTTIEDAQEANVGGIALDWRRVRRRSGWQRNAPQRRTRSWTRASGAEADWLAQIKNECLSRNVGASIPGPGDRAARRARPCNCPARTSTTDGNCGAADVAQGIGHSGPRAEAVAGTLPIVMTTRSQQPGAAIEACAIGRSRDPSSTPRGQEDSDMIVPLNEQRNATWLEAKTPSASSGATRTAPIHRARRRLAMHRACRALAFSSSGVRLPDRANENRNRGGDRLFAPGRARPDKFSNNRAPRAAITHDGSHVD